MHQKLRSLAQAFCCVFWVHQLSLNRRTHDKLQRRTDWRFRLSALHRHQKPQTHFITNITKPQTYFITNIIKPQTHFITNITKPQTAANVRQSDMTKVL